MAKKHIQKTKSTYDIWKIATLVFFVLFVLAVITGGFSGSKTNDLSKSKVSESTLDFVNKYVLQGQATATVESINELEGEDCLYNITLNIQDQTFESFVTKDGAILFPQAINMKALLETPPQAQQQQPTEIPKTDNPEVMLFTMAYCPYGNQAEEGIGPVVEAMGSDVEIQPHFVIYSNYQGGGPNYCLDNESKYCSMHGIQELHEDIRELCMYKYERANYWDYVLDVNSKCSASNVDTCWEAVAESHGMDTSRIKTCEENEALSLLAKEVELNAKYGVQGSPTLIINGATYSGARTPEAYKSSICSAFTTSPASCGAQLSDNGTAATGSC